MKKAIVTTRVVYHKIASVEVNVPDGLSEEQTRDWLFDNEHLFIDELDEKLESSSYNFGFGLVDGMDEKEYESETRYDLLNSDNKITFGGHI